jgi:pimeloyl-ACP methyl ester carboxylesterase
MAQIEANYDSMTAMYWERLLTDAQPSVREKVTARMRSVPREPSLAIIGGLMSFDPVPLLAGYPGPTLAIHSARESGPNDLQNLVAGLPHRTMEQTSHWMHMDKPEEFNRILDEFLAALK